ncbi:LAMI_0E03224g1_1 [Lachancea mirantina]|uniref:LAMI_0E03224g1_1 n=1 Tax=Lachancea mirantina TaxID=1230905 RepID=A0A1G4JJR1_9SACH|nr:LAMI_0E03224g1_1 [Lachancea mirantina]
MTILAVGRKSVDVSAELDSYKTNGTLSCLKFLDFTPVLVNEMLALSNINRRLSENLLYCFSNVSFLWAFSPERSATRLVLNPITSLESLSQNSPLTLESISSSEIHRYDVIIKAISNYRGKLCLAILSAIPQACNKRERTNFIQRIFQSLRESWLPFGAELRDTDDKNIFDTSLHELMVK